MLADLDCKNLREGDVVLVPMLVSYVTGEFEKPHGCKLVCKSSEVDHRMREEREKGPRRIEFMSRYVHSVLRRQIRVGDWVKCAEVTGKVVFLDNQEATIKRRGEWSHTRNAVIAMDLLERIPAPGDLNDEEKVLFK